MAEKKELPPSRTADPEDEPSAEWGWHGTFPVAVQVAGWLAAAVCFIMVTATHETHISWIYLCSIGVIIILFLLYDLRKRKTSWRNR